VSTRSRTFAPSNQLKNRTRTMEKNIKSWRDLLAKINEDLKDKEAHLSVMTDDGERYHIQRTISDENGELSESYYCFNVEEDALGEMLNEAWANVRLMIKNREELKEIAGEEAKREPAIKLVTFTITAEVSTKKLTVEDVITEMEFKPTGGDVLNWTYGEDAYMQDEE